MLRKLRDWAHTIKRDVLALWLAARDARTPWYAKVVAAGVAAYALSPLDLIPDFIPIVRYLDDLIMVPLGILLAGKLIPHPLMAEFRQQATHLGNQPQSRAGATAIVLLWVAAAGCVVWWLWPTVH